MRLAVCARSSFIGAQANVAPLIKQQLSSSCRQLDGRPLHCRAGAKQVSKRQTMGSARTDLVQLPGLCAGLPTGSGGSSRPAHLPPLGGRARSARVSG